MKAKSAVLLALLMCALFANGCDVCTSNTTVVGTMDADLYYPCNSSGPLPATTMMSGFMGTNEQVAWLARDVAASGYVVLALTPTNTLGMVSGWRDDHKAGIRKLKDLNNSGVLRGRIDTSKLSVCGHSKGGGGALWAADQLGGELASAVGMAPYQEQFFNLSGVRAATLIQAGAMDTLANGLMTRSEYSDLPNSISKGYFTYSVGHMAWASNNPSLSRDIIAWYDYYLKCDDSARSTLSGLGNDWNDRGNCSGTGTDPGPGCE